MIDCQATVRFETDAGGFNVPMFFFCGLGDDRHEQHVSTQTGTARDDLGAGPTRTVEVRVSWAAAPQD